MKQSKANRFILCILILAAMAAFAPAALANSAEPPQLTIIASFPPDDLMLSIRFADGDVTGSVRLDKVQKAWESYYRFYYGMVSSARPTPEGATLVVQSSEVNFECPLPASVFSQYNNLLTLNVAKQSVAVGQTPARSVFLVSMRVILTLLIEGLVFFAFGYRSKASWKTFFVVNLITQGALNYIFNLNGTEMGAYWIIAYAFYEAIIFIVEMFAYAFILKERKKSQAIYCALVANIASLILGGALISYLPV